MLYPGKLLFLPKISQSGVSNSNTWDSLKNYTPLEQACSMLWHLLALESLPLSHGCMRRKEQGLSVKRFSGRHNSSGSSLLREMICLYKENVRDFSMVG